MNLEKRICSRSRALLLPLACLAVATGLTAQQAVYDSEVQRTSLPAARVTRIQQPYAAVSTDGRTKDAVIETIRVSDSPQVTRTTTVTETQVAPKKTKTTKVAATDEPSKATPKHHTPPAKKKTHVTSTRTVAKAKEHVASKPVRTQTVVTRVERETPPPAVIYDNDAAAERVISAAPSPIASSQILTIKAAPAPRMTKAERIALLRSASPEVLNHAQQSTMVLEKLPDYAEGHGAEVTLFPPVNEETVVREGTTPPTLKEETHATPSATAPKEEYPVAERSEKRGFVKNPYAPEHDLDVTGLITGTLVRDPVSGRLFRVP